MFGISSFALAINLVLLPEAAANAASCCVEELPLARLISFSISPLSIRVSIASFVLEGLSKA